MFLPIIPYFGANYTKDGFTLWYSRYGGASYVAYNVFDNNPNTVWTNNAEQKAWLYVTFPKTYIPRKFTLSSPSDMANTNKMPNKFRVYGVLKDMQKLHQTYGITGSDIGVTTEPNWIGCQLLLEVNGGAGYWSPAETKEWIINSENREYIGFILYMDGKQTAWAGANEFAVGEMQIYEYAPPKDLAIIRRASDNKHVSIQKRIDKPFGGFSAFDRSETRKGFTQVWGYNNIRRLWNAHVASTYSANIIGEHEYSSGKWYFEVDFAKVAPTHMLGWASKYELDYDRNWVNDNVYLYCNDGNVYGATHKGTNTPYTRSTSGVERVGIAYDIDNNIFEAFYDGVGQGAIKTRNLPKPLVPLVMAASSGYDTTLRPDPKYLPKGYKNIVNKRSYEEIIVRLPEVVTVDDYKKYGIVQGEKIDFEKPYNKERVFADEKTNIQNGTVYSFQIVPSDETINKLRIE